MGGGNGTDAEGGGAQGDVRAAGPAQETFPKQQKFIFPNGKYVQQDILIYIFHSFKLALKIYQQVVSLDI